MRRRIAATMLAFLLAGIPLPGQTVSLGVISQSSGGHLNNTVASVGATVFDGDRITTEVAGGLTLRYGSVQLLLSEDSALLMNHDASTLTPMLQRGTVGFRVEGDTGLRISSGDVRVRPQSSALTVGQMTLENCAVVVTSRVQSLEVTAGKETKIVEEGKSYRVVFDGACANQKDQQLQSPLHSRFSLIPAAVIGITIWAVHEAIESPDSP